MYPLTFLFGLLSDDLKSIAQGKSSAISDPKLSIRARVEIYGLVGRAEINGTVGTISGFTPSTGRYSVAIEGTKKSASLKAANLKLVFQNGDRVQVHGLRNRAELNDSVGKVIDFTSSSGRYSVQLEGVEKPSLLKGTNLKPQQDAIPKPDMTKKKTSARETKVQAEFQNGDRVQVHGLLSRAEINGTIGKVIDFVSSSGRYSVQLEGIEKPSLLKGANLKLPPEPGQAPLPVDTKVEVHGLKSRPELNGFVGVVTEHVAATGRYGVLLEGQGQPALLKAANLRLVREDNTVKALCANCGATKCKKRCSGCESVRYCSKECATAHWKREHKDSCRRGSIGEGQDANVRQKA